MGKLEIKEKETQLIEKIPEKIVKGMDETKNKKNKALNTFLNLSIQVVSLQIKQKELLDKVKSLDESLNSQFQNAVNKLRLKKKTNYNWTFNGKDTFIGTLKSDESNDKK